MRDLNSMFNEAADAGRQAAAPLPAAQIRRVAARVRRVRAIATTTLSAAVVAAVVLVVTTAGIPSAAPGYVDSPSPTESTTAPPESPTTPPSSTPASTEPARPPIFDGQMLTVEEVAAQSINTLFPLTWAVDDGTTDATCQPADAGGVLDQGHVRYTALEAPYSAIDQWAEFFETPDAAADRLADLRAFYGACAEEQGDQVDLFLAYTMRGVGDDGFIVVMNEPLAEDSGLYVEVSAAVTGHVVTWTANTFDGQDYNGMPSPEAIVPAVNRLCLISVGPCTQLPVLDETYPRDIRGLTAGLMYPIDLGATLSGAWADSLQSLDEGVGRFGACDDVPVDGQLASVTAGYMTDSEDRSARETVRLFGSDGEADVLTAALAQCLDSDSTVTPADSLSGAWWGPTGELIVIRSGGPRVAVFTITLVGEVPDLGAVAGLVSILEQVLANEA